MKKVIALSAAAMLACTMAQAKEVKVDGKDAGDVSLMFKAMHIVDDNQNGFAPSNGSGYLVKLKYETADVLTEGLKVGVGMYLNGDTGATEWDSSASPTFNKPAKGMFVSNRGDSTALMGEAYVTYKNDMFHAKAGRQILDTPLTKIKWSLMPNFYEAYVVGFNPIDKLSVTVAQVTKMSFGSRAMTDWGLIGERTGTAGVAVKLTEDAGAVDQAKFHNIGVAALGVGNSNTNETDGITALGLTYTGIKNLKLDAWMYHADEIANDYYLEAGYTMPVQEGMKVKLSGQYLAQRDTGKELAGANSFEMLGAKVALNTKKWGVFAAYNNSSDGTNNKGFINPWGSDPAYTSSLFSRNAYRDNVSAYKIGGHYKIMKGLKLMVSHADYGQSDTGLGGSALASKQSTTDATETDIILAYKPTKELTLKVFNAIRTSE